VAGSTGRSGDGIEDAKEAHDDARERLEAAIARAYLADRPVAQIARMAAVSRPTFYAILRRRGITF